MTVSLPLQPSTCSVLRRPSLPEPETSGNERRSPIDAEVHTTTTHLTALSHEDSPRGDGWRCYIDGSQYAAKKGKTARVAAQALQRRPGRCRCSARRQGNYVGRRPSVVVVHTSPCGTVKTANDPAVPGSGVVSP
ncbi:hypothetical protein MRX96_035579 [Rhipicephalus microplus]